MAQVTNYMAGASRTLMSGLALYQREKESKREFGLAEKSHALQEKIFGREEEKHEADMAKRTPAEKGMSEEQVGGTMKSVSQIAEADLVKKVSTPITTLEFELVDVQIAKWAKQLKVPAIIKDFAPLKDAIEGSSLNQKNSRFQTFKMLEVEDTWNRLTAPIRETIKKAMVNATDKNEKARLTEALAAFVHDGKKAPAALTGVFPASHQHDQELKRKAMLKGRPKTIMEVVARDLADKPEKAEALLREMKSGKAKDSKTYEKPYKGPLGNLLQKEIGSGKVSRVSGKTGAGKSEKDKRLNAIRNNYFKQITQARSAAKNIDPIMKDIEVDVKAVREDANKKAKILADEYVKSGGKLEDLGLKEEKGKKTPNEMAEMPSASQHKGRGIIDTKTGKKYKSNGKSWVLQ